MSRKKKKKKSKLLNSVGVANAAIHKATGNETEDSTIKKIRRYIAKGQSKTALQAAKQLHKVSDNNASEEILVEAYLARINAIIDNGQINDAKTLLDILKRRYTLPNETFQRINAVISLRSGTLEELVASLALADTPTETRNAVEATIKKEMIDLAALARCNTLPLDHPLKIAAKKLDDAFTMVTSGPVDDSVLALSGVPRKSPLAPWKMLIRALAHFYRNEDELCAKYLAAIDPEAAPARLIPLIQILMQNNLTEKVDQPARQLLETVTGNRQEVRSALESIDQMLEGQPSLSSKKRKAFKQAIAVCTRHCPPLMETLKQHISVKGWLHNFASKDLIAAMGSVSLKNARFWRLYARAAELKNERVWAVTVWDEFRKHAVFEGWFPKNGRETAVLYLHMAGLLERLPSRMLERHRNTPTDRVGLIEKMYDQQPESILKAIQKEKKASIRPYFLYPELLYQKAIDIEPTADVFKRLLNHLRTNDSDWQAQDQVANQWHQAVPDDPQPLLFLMQAAEKRNALTKALKYLEKAEQADALNTSVKQARMRLLIAVAIRHLKQQKMHLAQKDFDQIKALPQLKEGDRGAFLYALHAVGALIAEDPVDFSKWHRQLKEGLENDIMVSVIMRGLVDICKLSPRKSTMLHFKDKGLTDEVLVTAIARGLALSDEMGIHLPFPKQFEDRLQKALSSDTLTADPAMFKIIAETALRDRKNEIAYMAAGAGMMHDGGTLARFLFLRAQSLPRLQSKRCRDCLTVSLELARRERNLGLVDEIIDFQHKVEHPQHLFLPFGPPKMDGKSDEEVQAVIAREKTERTDYPSFYDCDDDWDYEDDDRDMEDDDLFDGDAADDCKFCNSHDCPSRKAPYVGDVFDEEEDGNLDEDGLHIPPEKLFPFIEKLFKNKGKRGRRSPLEELMDMAPEDLEAMIEMMRPPEEREFWPDPINFAPKRRKKKRS